MAIELTDEEYKKILKIQREKGKLEKENADLKEVLLAVAGFFRGISYSGVERKQ